MPAHRPRKRWRFDELDLALATARRARDEAADAWAASADEGEKALLVDALALLDRAAAKLEQAAEQRQRRTQARATQPEQRRGLDTGDHPTPDGETA